jgi:tetratricopeptide (TPR) repeat protein
MEISLANARYRNALLAGCVLIAAVLIFQAVELWLADRWINSQHVHIVKRGAALIPSDGIAWDNLGHLQQWSLTDPDLPGAITDYRKALHDDPRSAHYWMDLASVDEASGNDSAAADAFVHAQAVYPDSAEVAFFYGNFLLREQDYSRGFEELRKAVRGDSSFLPLALSRAWRATRDANEIVDKLLPPGMDAYLETIDYFAGIQQCDAALAVWSRLSASKSSVPLPKTFPLLDELIRENRSADARRVWFQALSGTKLGRGNMVNGSLIWNGDFAEDLSGGGLGWRWDPVPGAYLSFDAAPAGSGSRSLRLDFNDGLNINLDGPSEYVPVAPARSYHFHALMRTDQITTESGPRFWIADPNHQGAVNVLTDNFTGTRPWSPVDADFTTGPQTQFVVVHLVRSPSQLFDNKLGGTVWIADVSLRAAPAPAASEQRR